MVAHEWSAEEAGGAVGALGTGVLEGLVFQMLMMAAGLWKSPGKKTPPALYFHHLWEKRSSFLNYQSDRTINSTGNASSPPSRPAAAVEGTEPTRISCQALV